MLYYTWAETLNKILSEVLTMTKKLYEMNGECVRYNTIINRVMKRVNELEPTITLDELNKARYNLHESLKNTLYTDENGVDYHEWTLQVGHIELTVRVFITIPNLYYTAHFYIMSSEQSTDDIMREVDELFKDETFEDFDFGEVEPVQEPVQKPVHTPYTTITPIDPNAHIKAIMARIEATNPKPCEVNIECVNSETGNQYFIDNVPDLLKIGETTIGKYHVETKGEWTDGNRTFNITYVYLRGIFKYNIIYKYYNRVIAKIMNWQLQDMHNGNYGFYTMRKDGSATETDLKKLLDPLDTIACNKDINPMKILDCAIMVQAYQDLNLFWKHCIDDPDNPIKASKLYEVIEYIVNDWNSGAQQLASRVVPITDGYIKHVLQRHRAIKYDKSDIVTEKPKQCDPCFISCYNEISIEFPFLSIDDKYHLALCEFENCYF